MSLAIDLSMALFCYFLFQQVVKVIWPNPCYGNGFPGCAQYNLSRSSRCLLLSFQS